MIKRKLQYIFQTTGKTKSKGAEKTLISQAQRRVLNIKNQEQLPASFLFFTTHKCASSFIPHYLKIIENYSSLTTWDYARAIWDLGDKIELGQENPGFLSKFLNENADSLFFQKGEIYAPLRIPVDFTTRKNFNHIFFLRDPRDVLVSSFYSFGFSHGLANNTKQKQHQLQRRKLIQEKGIDNHALDYAKDLLNRYTQYQKFRDNCNSHLYLKYDYFTSNPKGFIQSLNTYLNIEIPNEEVDTICNLANPIQNKVDITKHQRSGKNNQYLNELKEETINKLNSMFENTLDYWEFKR